jgi:CHAT domain-containing protein/tetratricopeptide (TPR) repeat protein
VKRILIVLLACGALLAAWYAFIGREGPGSHGRSATEFDALLLSGSYTEAENAARVDVEALLNSKEPADIDRANAIDRLSLASIRNGRPADTERLALARQALALKEAVLGTGHADLAPTLLNLAEMLAAAGEFPSAIDAARRAQMLIAGSDGRNESDQADVYHRLGRVLSAARQNDEAFVELERSLAIRERMAAAVDLTARTLEDVGLVLQRQGNYARSGAVLRRALSMQESLSRRHPAYATTLNLMAQQLWFEGDLIASKETSERAVEIATSALRPDHPTRALALRYLAATLFDLGDSTRALALTEEALATAERNYGTEHHVTAEYLNDLGFAQFDLGDYVSARTTLERALRIYEARYGGWHEYVATTLLVLARANAGLGDFDRAGRDQDRALAIHTKVSGSNHPFVALTLMERAAVHRARGVPLEARPLIERALSIREENLGPDHRDVARTMLELASVLTETGRAAQAHGFAERALRIWERLDLPDAPEYATVLALYADLRARRGDFASARTFYGRALQIRSRVFGPTNPVYAEAQSALAPVLAALGDRAAALDAAFESETVGRDHLRLMLQSLSERQALHYAATRPRGLDLLLTLSATTPEAARAAADSVVKSRALVLDEIAARHAVGRALPPQLADDWGALLSARQRLANLMVRGPGQMSADQYGELVEQARGETETLERSLAGGSADFRSAMDRARVGLDEVIAAIPAGSALLSFVRYSRIRLPSDVPGGSAGLLSETPFYAAIVLRSNQPPVAVPVGPAADVDRLVSAWRQDVSVADDLHTLRSRSSADADLALRRLVWDPIAGHIAGATRLFVVPDGSLSLLPLAALRTEARTFLLDEGPTIHYLSAERDLLQADQTITSGQLLAIGGPAFDEAAPGDSAASPRGPDLAAGAGPQAAMRGTADPCMSLETVNFQALPGTLDEARDVAGVWQVGGTAARILIGREATETALKLGARHSRILHLATHGFFLNTACAARPVSDTRGVGGLVGARANAVANPLLLSGLALAGANRRASAGPDQDDGILTAEEVASLDLSGVEWAVLSACDTGVGEIRAGEGVFGLRRAFQVAGARTVIMSLWSVDDQATRAWMRALYEGRFQQRLSTADAVHAASVAVLKDRRAKGLSTHPFYWAAFVAAGDWR